MAEQMAEPAASLLKQYVLCTGGERAVHIAVEFKAVIFVMQSRP